MTAVQSAPRDLVFISDSPPIIETETEKFIVLKKYIPGSTVKTQNEMNIIVYTSRFCLYEASKVPTIHIAKDWFQKFKVAGITKIVFEENSQFTRLKGLYSIVEMNQTVEAGLKKLQKAEKKQDIKVAS